MRNKKEKILLCDIDDVMWDFIPHMVNWYNQLSSEKIKVEDFKEWDVSKVVPQSRLDIFWSIPTWQTFWDEIEPRFGAYKYAQLLNQEYELYFVTATRLGMSDHKINKFLNMFNWVKPNQIIICQNKSMIKGDLLIDDAYHQLQNFTGKKLLVTRSWNEVIDTQNSNMTRGYDWSDIYIKVCELLKGNTDIGKK